MKFKKSELRGTGAMKSNRELASSSSFYRTADKKLTDRTVHLSENTVPPLDDALQRISYITDVEGDAEYFDRFIEISKIMRFEAATPNFDETRPLEFFPYTKQVVFLESSDAENGADSPIFDDTMLVCGGDIWDKGGGDLYVARQLLSLQNRYGDDRVHFIIGNRDVNKMRILQEIGPGEDDVGDDNLPPHDGVYWLRGTGLKGDPDLINMFERSSPTNSYRSSHATVSSSAAARLTWMLQDTLGCPDAFELRRGELKREKEICARARIESTTHDTEIDCTVTDEEVVQSYRTSCHPTAGVMGEYLRKGKLAMKIGSILFVHGSVPVSAEILMEYKAYRKRLDAYHKQLDNVSDMRNSCEESYNIQEEKDRFWTNFFHHAMPWLAKSKPSSISVDKIFEMDDGTCGNSHSTTISSGYFRCSKYIQSQDLENTRGNIPEPEPRSWCNIIGLICKAFSVCQTVNVVDKSGKVMMGNHASRNIQEDVNRDTGKWITSTDESKDQDDDDNLNKHNKRRISFAPCVRPGSMVDETGQPRRQSAPPIIEEQKVSILLNDEGLRSISLIDVSKCYP